MAKNDGKFGIQKTIQKKRSKKNIQENQKISQNIHNTKSVKLYQHMSGSIVTILKSVVVSAKVSDQVSDSTLSKVFVMLHQHRNVNDMQINYMEQCILQFISSN